MKVLAPLTSPRSVN